MSRNPHARLGKFTEYLQGATTMSSPVETVPLTSGWEWRLSNTNGDKEAEKHVDLKEWHDVTQGIPSVIHSELLASKSIEDYRHGENERQIQWVGCADWEYSCSFPTPEYKANEVDLVLEGLDTIATVTLNGKEILHSENQFIPHRIPVKADLKAPGHENELSIVFCSTVTKGKELEDKYGKRKALMRDPVRNHFRKAGYHWGWDWGPIVLTAGPWKPIYLQHYDSRIADAQVIADLADDHKSANVTVNIRTAGSSEKAKFRTKISDHEGNEIESSDGPIASSGDATSVLKITDPKLWWPNGQGDQHLYTVEVSLLTGDKVIDSQKFKVGIRTISLIQRSLTDAPGKTFMFNVNGRDIFAQGACWIPADNLLTTVTRERYFEWMKLAKFNHLNMVRVWGGGIYETDDFFDACDEMGLLVWHDFAFACGDYPTHPSYLENVKAEAKAQVLRIRNKTSLALLCGNNEDFMLEDWLGDKYDFQDHTGPFLDKPFPQREIYLRILPEICKDQCPHIPYWPSSPWGGESANDTTVGDIHQWNVWHVDQKPYQSYKTLSGRFVSELGMHAFPVERTVSQTYFLDGANPTPQEHRHPQSQLIDARNKGHGAETRLARYLAENFRYDSTNLSNWIYSTQLLQAEAYGYAYRDWKRKFNGPGREECAGALVWQFNDCWPTTSWAFADYYVRPKPSSYVIRRACADVSIGSERTPASRWINEDKPAASRVPRFDIFAHNMTSEDKECVLIVRAYDFTTGQWTKLSAEEERRHVTLRTGYNTELCSLAAHESWKDESLVILETKLLDPTTNETLARYLNWPEPYRYMYWPKDTNVEVEITEAGDKKSQWEDSVTVRANHPVKGCWLEPVYDGTEKIDDLEPLWEDNMLDLMPDEPITIGVNGLKGRKVKVRFLYDWELQ
ncbi:hypothetical protein H2200_004677 [Cladophialophora chaetospira]|uniref:Beta-mannosidase B n=1 Tax=Cladophialophora chaetospira TaxID=386627 RepID=A0AA39CKE0_9EURO|nr:hypothetical protein H2200_004677 [Cladophialophora chaetospira]